MARKHQQQSPLALIVVIALHIAALGGLLQYPPQITAASAEVMHVSLITLPAPLPTVQLPTPPEPRVRPRKIERAIAPPPPLEIPSETAISEPPAPEPDPAPIVASAAPAPPAPIVLPRFDVDYLRNPPPFYPALSRRSGEQGRVLLRVVVRPDGSPQTVELRQSSGSPRLDEAALDAVRRWRFVPARQGNVPITAAVIVPIVFSLES